MVRNCSIAIVIWILLVAGYGYWLWPQVHDEARWIVPLVMGSVVWAGLALMHGARYELRDWRARNKLARGERPQDGDLVSAIGAIKPVFEPLRAPFTGRECVLYSYQIGPPPSRGEMAKDYAGYGMVPCEVQTQYGTFRLGNFPVLENVPKDRGDRNLGDEYVRTTTFEEMHIGTVAKRMFAVLTQPPPLRVDWQIGQPSHHSGAQYIEQILAPGQTVSAYGRYVSATNAIVSDTKDKGYLRVRPGGDARGVSSFPSAAVNKFFGGIAIVIAANVVMWLLLKVTPR